MKHNKTIIRTQNLNVFYQKKQALFNVNIELLRNQVTALIGPSGCGKTTFLRCLNRMNDLVEGCRVEGSINIDELEINSHKTDVVQLRKKVGMVFQKPNPFPKSIFQNVAYGIKIHGLRSSKTDLNTKVEEALEKVGLLQEVAGRWHEPATALSGGQQQRLCIARTIATDPEIILMDEPTSALDPITTAKIEQLIEQLAKNYTIIIVTHSMQQAARISNHTAFFKKGYLVEVGETKSLFTNPKKKETEDYITVRSS